MRGGVNDVTILIKVHSTNVLNIYRRHTDRRIPFFSQEEQWSPKTQNTFLVAPRHDPTLLDTWSPTHRDAPMQHQSREHTHILPTTHPSILCRYMFYTRYTYIYIDMCIYCVHICCAHSHTTYVVGDEHITSKRTPHAHTNAHHHHHDTKYVRVLLVLYVYKHTIRMYRRRTPLSTIIWSFPPGNTTKERRNALGTISYGVRALKEAKIESPGETPCLAKPS